MTLHMIRLCVGCDTIDDLVAWHGNSPDPWPLHTRMAPKRVDELLDGGSLYRIFRGLILCRQRILSIARVEAGGESHCRIDLEPRILRVVPTPRRAFQGWRYLDPADAPPDLDEAGGEGIPDDLARRLREAGAW